MFGDRIGSLLSPRLDWVQVEVSSHCEATCFYCPHTVYKSAWLNRHMPLETYRKMLRSLRNARLIYLQGWGEPLLHPDFLEMVALAKRHRRQVGTTTNGMPLDERMMAQLVELGMDVVAFSLAGADEKNDTFRAGTHIGTILENIRTLARIKERRGADRPLIHIAYMLLRSGLDDVRRLPSVLQGLGVDQVVISTLDFVPDASLESETLRPATMEEHNELRMLLEEVMKEGRRLDLDIHYQISVPAQRSLTCTENVRRALVVSSDGSVSPCVFTNLPVSGGSYLVDGAERAYRRLSFGDFAEQPLARIWRRKDYRAFRRSFSTDRLAEVCRGCPKLYASSR